MRQFGRLSNDLTAEDIGGCPLKIIVQPTQVETLDRIWRDHVPNMTPKEFVLRALRGLRQLVPEHNRVYVTFGTSGVTKDGAPKMMFELKLQKTVEGTNPTSGSGASITRNWQPIGPSAWAQNLAGATRELTFHKDVLEVSDQRTDAPTGKQGGSGFTTQLFKNLVDLYQATGKARTVIDLSAKEEGRYVWGRYGFLPEAADWNNNIRKPIREKIQPVAGPNLADDIAAFAESKGTPVDKETAAQIAAALDREDPAALFTLLDIPKAKNLLWWLFTQGPVGLWKGRLDLGDAAQRQRLLDYLARPTPPPSSAAPPPVSAALSSSPAGKLQSTSPTGAAPKTHE
jgi:hypothetical protein